MIVRSTYLLVVLVWSLIDSEEITEDSIKFGILKEWNVICIGRFFNSFSYILEIVIR